MNIYPHSHSYQISLSCQTHCQSKEKQSEELKPEQVISSIEKNFAAILEKELASLSDRKETEIEELEKSLSKLRNENVRLEGRNRLDKENETRLKEEVRQLSGRIRELESNLEKQRNVEIYHEKSKAVPITEPKIIYLNNAQNNEEKHSLKEEITKLRSKIFELEEKNKELRDRLDGDAQQNKNIIQELNDQLKQVTDELNVKNQTIFSLNEEKLFLEQKIQIIDKPQTQPHQPLILHKLIHQAPEIRTVYVERPVKETKLIEVEKIVRHFVEPDRPIVNRIVECKSDRKCRCDSSDEDSDEKYVEFRESEERELRDKQYGEVIQGYKREREQLVKVLEERDSDYRILEKKMDLYSQINSRPSQNRQGHTHVDVTVYRNEKEPDNIPPKKETLKSKKTATKNVREK